MGDEWGPLAKLAGEWEGAGAAWIPRSPTPEANSHTIGTPYLEVCTMKPFGPVDNGRQRLYGLDYPRSAMWRGAEKNPFHTEVGYWLWDAATGEILRGFVVPRGITVLAGGTTTADATTFVLQAGPDEQPQYTIGENQYLAKNASTLSYAVTITAGDYCWSYDETTMLKMNEFP